MKYAMILPDGAADEPVEALDGRTPLEAARTPHIDWIAENGRQGCVVTVPRGFTPGSDVATMSLFGYDPRTCYFGRAPLEAAAMGLETKPTELVFRCNFVTVVDGRMEDFTAGHIRNLESEQLVADLNERLGIAGCRFYAGVSYRNLMVWTPPDALEAVCTPPHDIPDQPVVDHQPTGPGAEWIVRIMERARMILADHDINLVRRDLGENPVTDIWLWGQGRARRLEPFETRYGVRASCVAAVDLVRGLAKSAGMTVLHAEGATGYLDTDYSSKGRTACAGLDHSDLVIVHIEAPDEAGHLGDADAKIVSLERIDEFIVGPLLDRLRAEGSWRVLVAPDHPTPVSRRVHTATPPPFCLAGEDVTGVVRRPFSETTARESDLQINPGHELMEYFLRTGSAKGMVMGPRGSSGGGRLGEQEIGTVGE